MLLLVATVLAWEPQGPGVPDRDTVRERIDQFTTHGRDLAVQLRVLLGGCRAGSPAVARARATLREAGRRLPLDPPIAPHDVVRAQNLGRLVALHRAVELVLEEESRDAGQGASGRGCPSEDFT
ncbi:hypothetical protein ABTY53_14190 [Streptomyces noursei]|uniref:hypothetical protein n=1 Tax=Streptomyces noursei TaxID=1971 RepID=UPI003317D744